jgi:hypothetical protein
MPPIPGREPPPPPPGSTPNEAAARPTLSPTLRRAVEDALSARFGTRVRLAGVEDFPYARVSRCTLDAPGGATPPTVVVRVPRDDPARSGLARLGNERAALELLRAVGSHLAPQYIAGDATGGFLVTEDLGPYPSLLDLLLGDDAGAAHRGLLAFARGLGQLHAQTAGRASEYAARPAAPGPGAVFLGGGVPVADRWRSVRDAVARLGLPPPLGVEDDVEAVGRALGAPGTLLALSSGDPSPVNCKVVAGAVRFFDFEDAGFRHALLDATVLRYLYPTGGPPWRLPLEVAGPLEPAYRAAAAPGCPGVLDDAAYEQGMAAAGAAWTILRLARLPRVEAGPDRDRWPLVPPGWSGPIPSRSRRRQLVAILETWVDSARRAGTLETLAGWSERLIGALRARWPEAAEDLPLYPAFSRQEAPGCTTIGRARGES